MSYWISLFEVHLVVYHTKYNSVAIRRSKTGLIFNVLPNDGMSVGWDVKWCPLSRITTLCHAKDCFPEFPWRVGSQFPPGKLQNVIYSVIFFIVTSLTCLENCRLGVYKHKIINQSIKQREINFRMIYVIACHIFTMYVF